MRIYLAGKMRGCPNFNHQSFREATAWLRSQGHEVFSPVESSETMYGPDVYMGNPEGDEEKAGIDGRKVFAADLAWICAHADAVMLLPGWRTSKGATAEHAVALALGLLWFEYTSYRAEVEKLSARRQDFLAH